MLVANRMT